MCWVHVRFQTNLQLKWALKEFIFDVMLPKWNVCCTHNHYKIYIAYVMYKMIFIFWIQSYTTSGIAKSGREDPYMHIQLFENGGPQKLLQHKY